MNKKALIAQETLEIIKTGNYTINGFPIDIEERVNQSLTGTTLYTPESIDNQSLQPKIKYTTSIQVFNETTLGGAKSLLSIANDKVGVLNFASAKNPGGGFINGAQAQEESLARSSTLYPGLILNTEMYKFNKSRRTYLYSDYMVYSKDVVVFRNDDMDLLEDPYQIDIVTSPAVNLGAIRDNKPSEEKELEEVMLQRMDKMLASFYLNDIKHIVLGAWGCGVFRNSSDNISQYFNSFLGEGGKYEGAFKSIRFSVLDSRNVGTFESFKKLQNDS